MRSGSAPDTNFIIWEYNVASNLLFLLVISGWRAGIGNCLSLLAMAICYSIEIIITWYYGGIVWQWKHMKFWERWNCLKSAQDVKGLWVKYSASWGRRRYSLPLTTNFSQNVTEPSKGISYPVGDLCWHFTRLAVSSVYTLHSNPIPPTDGTNGILWLVAYISQTGHQCFPACFCHGEFWCLPEYSVASHPKHFEHCIASPLSADCAQNALNVCQGQFFLHDFSIPSPWPLPETLY